MVSDLKGLPSRRDEETGQFRQQCKHFTVKESVSKRKTQLEAKWHTHPVSKACGQRRGRSWGCGRPSSNPALASWLFFQPSAPTQTWAVPDTSYNGWNSAQGVISCRIVLLLLLFQKWHNSLPQVVTMIGATCISHSNALCLKSTLKLCLLQSALYKSILVQNRACTLLHKKTKVSLLQPYVGTG